MLELSLTALIRERTEGKGQDKMSVHKLVKYINDANAAAKTGCSVNEQSVRRLLRGDTAVGLTQKMWFAVTTAFPELKHRPVFVIPGVLELLVGAPKVVFMLGAKARPEERRNDISHWDALSLAELLTQCSKLDQHHQFDIQYVMWRPSVQSKALLSERWYRLLEDDESSVISIGSPLVSLSSEVMLARMFNVEPFLIPHFMPRGLPFCFVWRPKVAQGLRSAFGLTAEGLALLKAKVAGKGRDGLSGNRRDHPEAATEAKAAADVKKLAADVRNDRASAFVLEKTIHPVSSKGDHWTMHGIIAAQRRASGNLWLVVSGIAGPATYAAATMVDRIAQELPWAKGQPSKVLWVPVKVSVQARRSSSGAGDIREARRRVFDGPARFWS